MRGVAWTFVTLVVVVAAGGLVADGVVRARTENEIAAQVRVSIPGLDGEPDVSIGGFPFLTQLARGRIDALRATAPAATVEGLRLEDVVVDLTGVTTQAPYVAEGAVMTALTTPDAVEAVLDVELDLEVRDGELVARTDLMGVPLEAVVLPRAVGREVEVDVTELLLAGVAVDDADLPAGLAEDLKGIRFTVPGLPDGMTLTGVGVVADGLLLSAVGSNLSL
jgi:hypothetical protein